MELWLRSPVSVSHSFSGGRVVVWLASGAGPCHEVAVVEVFEDFVVGLVVVIGVVFWFSGQGS